MTAEEDLLLMETQYLPPVQTMAYLLHFGGGRLEARENYQKGSYRNRCYIAGPNGRQRLSVPLEKGKHQQTPIRAVRTTGSGQWARRHWSSIQTAYGSAPFFPHYAPDLKPTFDRPPPRLFDLNLRLLTKIIDLLSLPVRLSLTERYVRPVPSGPTDLRGRIRPGGPRDPWFQPMRYPQVFEDRHGFLPNMSILDLLFCVGPQAPAILAASLVRP